MTGCAYLYVRVNRLGATENEQSPFANGLPGRVTIVGEGMPMYDPRFDSTRGGSGSMRVDNQNTWGPSSGNPIIQSLNVLLGWRINGKLSVGAGIPAKYINFDSVITAANACDEDIVLSGGGTQPRYRTAGAFSTDDAPMNIVGALLAGCAGDLLDSDGQLSFLIKTNTLAVPAVTFDDHDILSAGRWDPMGGQTNLPNIISGKEAAEGAQAAATTQAGLSATARNQSEAFAAVSQGASVQSNQAASAAAASADVSARFSQTITSAPAMEAKYFRQTTGGAPETGNDTSIEFFDGADGRHARLPIKIYIRPRRRAHDTIVLVEPVHDKPGNRPERRLPLCRA